MTTESWSLTVRLSSGERFAVTVASTATVSECKNAIQTCKSELVSSRQRLVYKGRILDDGSRQLSDYGVVDQATLFLVMSSPAAPSTSGASAGATSSTTTPRPAPSANQSQGAPALNPLFGGANAFGSGMMGNGGAPPSPEQMSQMMNSPMMQGLLENPQMMQAAMNMTMQSNPQLQAIREHAWRVFGSQ